jgi:predicted dehydrogenase
MRLSPPPDWNAWMVDPAKSGGVPVDLLIHDFDQMNWLLGMPRRVFARAPQPDHVHALVEYDDAQGFAEGSMAMPKSYPFSSGVRVLAEGGVAEYAFSAAPAEDGGNIGASDSVRGLWLYPRGGKPVSVPVEPADPWGPEIAAFVESVETGRAPQQGTGPQARLALAVSLAAARSLVSGQPEDVAA